MRLCVLLISVFIVPAIDAFAITLLRSHCDRPLDIGVKIMGKDIEYNNDYNIMAFDSGGNRIANGSYVPLPTTISLKIEPKLNQAVFEIQHDLGIRFSSEYCEGKRALQENAVIHVDRGASSFQNLTVAAVWAKSYSLGVKRTDNFVFYFMDSSEEL